MIACIRYVLRVRVIGDSPSSDSLGESLNTLRYANNAKNIQNKPVINQDRQSCIIEAVCCCLRGGMLQLRREIEYLKKELAGKQNLGILNNELFCSCSRFFNDSIQCRESIESSLRKQGLFRRRELYRSICKNRKLREQQLQNRISDYEQKISIYKQNESQYQKQIEDLESENAYLKAEMEYKNLSSTTEEKSEQIDV